jgi:uncharacterized membrane protein
LSEDGEIGRIVAVDIARTAAIIGMVVFHFALDLGAFGLLEHGTTQSGGWAALARLVAGSFLFLTGVSLVLAHGQGIGWQSFMKRLAVIVAAATAVSAATFFAVPQNFIYFGILHAIAASSLLAILFVRTPAWVSGVSALAIWTVYSLVYRSLYLPIWLGWTGLGVSVRPALDFIPLVPWLASCMLGVAVAKIARPYLRHGRQRSVPFAAQLAWPGRYSLAIYLLHQPIILGIMWLVLRSGLIG